MLDFIHDGQRIFFNRTFLFRVCIGHTVPSGQMAFESLSDMILRPPRSTSSSNPAHRKLLFHHEQQRPSLRRGTTDLVCSRLCVQDANTGQTGVLIMRKRILQVTVHAWYRQTIRMVVEQFGRGRIPQSGCHLPSHRSGIVNGGTSGGSGRHDGDSEFIDLRRGPFCSRLYPRSSDRLFCLTDTNSQDRDDRKPNCSL